MIRQLGILSPLIGLCGCVALDSQIVQERFCKRAMGLLYPNCRIEPAEHAPARERIYRVSCLRNFHLRYGRVFDEIRRMLLQKCEEICIAEGG